MDTHKNDIIDVIILGHSLAEVDMPYFRKIENLLDVESQWRIDYFPHDEVAKRTKLQRFSETMGFDALAYELP
jgi:hypothetical protein